MILVRKVSARRMYSIRKPGVRPGFLIIWNGKEVTICAT
jgi:hypothetical protein